MNVRQLREVIADLPGEAVVLVSLPTVNPTEMYVISTAGSSESGRTLVFLCDPQEKTK